MSSLLEEVQGNMGLKLASSCANVTPHLWAWPVAKACFPPKRMRRELWFVCRWEKHSAQTLPQPALNYCNHFCPRPLYVCLIEYYINFSVPSTIIYIKLLHEDNNKWLPPSTRQCCIVCWHSSAPCGLWSWFDIRPPGQMLRSRRPWRSHISTTHQPSMILQQ